MYRDEIGVIIDNTGKEIIRIEKYDRIAQLVINKLPEVEIEEIEDIKSIKGNRNGGFGSSGIK